MKLSGSKWAGLIIGVVVLALAVIIFPLILSGSDSILCESQTDTATGVVSSGAPGFSGTMTLTQPLYDDSVAYVTSVTSSSGTDTPVASTFSGATDILTVTGLDWAGTRTLTTVYDYDQTDSYTGLGDLVEVAPLLIWISIIFGLGVVSVFAYRKL